MKIRKIVKSTVILALIALFISSCSNDDDNNQVTPKQIEMAVLAKGPSVMQVKELIHAQTNEVLQAGCFLMDLIDPVTGENLGTLQDCVINDVFNDDGTITSRVISIINLRDRGTISSENQVLQTPTGSEGFFTTLFHPTENNIIDGTGEFEGISGTVALDGVIDVTQFETKGIVGFECTFTVDGVTYN